MIQTVFVAPSFAACDSFNGYAEPREANTAKPCGSAGNTIDARHLIGLRAQEAVAVGRRHGCAVRVEVRDGQVVANGDVQRPRTSIGVIVRDAEVYGLC